MFLTRPVNQQETLPLLVLGHELFIGKHARGPAQEET